MILPRSLADPHGGRLSDDESPADGSKEVGEAASKVLELAPSRRSVMLWLFLKLDL